MEEIRIKSEKLAERCEVCHKTDYFDPTKNICKRCGLISTNYKNEVEQITERRLQISQKWYSEGYHPIKLLLFSLLPIGCFIFSLCITQCVPFTSHSSYTPMSWEMLFVVILYPRFGYFFCKLLILKD